MTDLTASGGLTPWEEYQTKLYPHLTQEEAIEKGKSVRRKGGKNGKGTPKSFNKFRDIPGYAKEIRARGK